MSTEQPLTLQATQRETEKEPEQMLEVGGGAGRWVGPIADCGPLWGQSPFIARRSNWKKM